MRIRPGIEVSRLTDVGHERETNEDHYSYWEAARDEDFERLGRVAIVADGMGGHEGGQEASRIAVEVVPRAYAESSAQNPQSRLIDGFREAHKRVQSYALEHPELRGMGTTYTAACVVNDQLYFAHVGDSRLYLVRGQGITRLTRDHTYVGRLLDTGVISSEEAKSHPQKHILTAAVGAGTDIDPDCPAEPITLQASDVLVLCTDGLWGMIRDAELLKIVSTKSPEEASELLVDRAKERGGPDNITVQILRVSSKS